MQINNSKTTTVLGLGQVGRGDVELAGGKGANLGELLQAGFTVPDGFIVTAPAYMDFFNQLDIDNGFPEKLSSTDIKTAELCGKIRAGILTADFPNSLKTEVMDRHRDLADMFHNNIVYAVRSSATAEDWGDASFAGQHGTYYYVTEADLLEKIKQCWASLWSPEAVSYRVTQGIDHRSVYMAVVVQRMIPAEISGVSFTVHPVTGNASHLVIESSWGMGAAIVDGRVTPDHYVMIRPGLGIHEMRISDKRFMVPAVLQDGGPSRQQEVPFHLRKEPTLTEDLARQVADMSVRAEEHFGSPQDVEWAIHQDRCYMLQSRPVTIAGERTYCRNSEAGKYVLFKPAVENFTEPLTPMGQELFKFLGPVFIGGRMYGDLNKLRKIIPFKISDQQLVDLLYLSEGESRQEFRIDPLKLPLALLIIFFYYLETIVLCARTRHMPDDFMCHTRTVAECMLQDPRVKLKDITTEFFLRPGFFDPAGAGALAVNLTVYRHWLWMNILKKLVRRWVPEAPDTVEHLLASGSDGVLSAATGRGIWELAKIAKSSDRVADILLNTHPEKVMEILSGEPEAKVFNAHLDAFLRVNGHRAIRELEPMAPRWRDNPATVIGMVRNYLLADRDPGEFEAKTAASRRNAELYIHDRLMIRPIEGLLGIRWRLVRYAAGRTKYFMKLRENSRFYHIMSVSTVRSRVQQIEARLLDQGRLKCRDDVFFLYMDELEDLSEGRLQWFDVEERIRERRMEYVRLSKLSPPKAIGVEYSKPASFNEIDDNVLHGHCASPGTYEGKARVILDPSIDAEIAPGEILVAPYTDPAWTPLFLIAGAAVVEVGSFLSHAGTVAREYGMPCVVDLQGCTTLIKSGDRLRVDGTAGTVYLLDTAQGKQS